MNARKIVPYMLAALLAGFLSFGAYLAFFAPQLNAAEKLRSDTATLATENDVLEARADLIRAQAADLPALVSQAKDFAAVFPSENDQQQIIADVHGAANSSGATITGLVVPASPKPFGVDPAIAAGEGADPAAGAVDPSLAALTPGQNLFQADVTIEADADSLGDLEKFVRTLEGLDRPMKIESYTVTAADKKDKITITAKSFIAAPLVEPKR